MYRICCCLLLLTLTTCQRPDTLFEPLSAGETGIDFANRMQESADFNVLKYGYFYNGGGVAAADFNNDGFTDLFFTGNIKANKLYLNKGDSSIQFDDITEKAGVAAADGWNTGVSVVDINADGWLDIYVCRSGAKNPALRRNLLFVNNKDLTFSEKAADYGLGDTGYSTQAAFFDYDRDGDLDCFLLNHSVQEYAGFSRMISDYKQQTNPDYTSKLYQNRGGRFVDVSAEAGIVGNVLSFGLGLAVSDFNDDGWPDIYVSNDYNENDYLYINQQNGRFRESVREAMGHTSLFSMGSDAADVNNDGRIDLLTLDMLPEGNERIKLTSGDDNFDKYDQLIRAGFHHQTMRNMLQLNMGGVGQETPVFAEIGQYAGVSNTDWSWAGLMADFDNDGWKDVFITNGYARDYTNMEFLKFTVDAQLKARETGQQPDPMDVIGQMPAISESNYIFRNTGPSLRFENKTAEWGFNVPTQSNGAVYADFDNDGDLDLIINNVNDKAGVYENHTTERRPNHHLGIDLRATNPARLVGAQVRVWAGGQAQVQEFQPVRGFQSAMYGPLLFGLGTSARADSVQVRWADGTTQTAPAPATPRLIISYAPTGQSRLTPPPAPVWQPAAGPTGTLPETPVNDFKIQPLLPHWLSETGPRFAVGDANGDGRDDVFVGGSRGQAGQVWLQRPGGWGVTAQPALLADKEYEDAGAVWFDADNDRDRDLLVVSAGYELTADDARLQPRLYRNDGRGNLSPAPLPTLRLSASCVRVADVDADGDPDVFLGARVVPGRYPERPVSQLLINQGGGRFVAANQPALRQMGMVTDAAFADLNADNVPELLVATDFGPIQLYTTRNGQLQPVQAPTLNTMGCWNRLLLTDIDHDGDPDVVAANAGLNSQLRASAGNPLTLYGLDSPSGVLLPILTTTDPNAPANTPPFPFNARDEMLDQVVGLRPKFTNYTQYASATIADLFPAAELDKAQKLTATELRTVVFRNDQSGGRLGTFTMLPLPAEAQFAPVFALTSTDVNADGLPDLLLGGNREHTRVRIGKADANLGQLFLNQGKGQFRYVPMPQSGLRWFGDVRDLALLRQGDTPLLLVGAINQPLRSYTLAKVPGNR
jgi:enediyne biosynthesis protein E4